jgi:four helix bundle protein
MMLRIYTERLDVLRDMRGALGAIDKRDPDLARQLRRAASSVVLNVAEGSGSFGRYVEAMRGSVIERMNHIIGTLVRVAA